MSAVTTRHRKRHNEGGDGMKCARFKTTASLMLGMAGMMGGGN